MKTHAMNMKQPVTKQVVLANSSIGEWRPNNSTEGVQTKPQSPRRKRRPQAAREL